MLIIMGAAISPTRADADLYEALERWLTQAPGGRVVSNLEACALFAAMSGASPTTCAAIGETGVPEMWNRGQFDGVAAGAVAAGDTLGNLIPPSVGPNLFVINGVAPDIPLATILKGSMPFVACMALAIVILSVFSRLATGLPDLLMGAGR